MAGIKITITTADKTLGEKLIHHPKDDKGEILQPYKYAHSKLLLTRLRTVKASIANMPEETQVGIMRNTLIGERNIAAFAAEQYGELNQAEIFNDLTEIVTEIDAILKA